MILTKILTLLDKEKIVFSLIIVLSVIIAVLLFKLYTKDNTIEELSSIIDKKSKDLVIYEMNLNECRKNIDKQNEIMENLEENYRQIQQIWLQKQEEISKNNKKIEELRKEVERKEGKTCQDAIKNIDSVLKQNLYL